MNIYCCQCRKGIDANLVTGKEIYPHRKDLHRLPFWQCPTCRNYVGCHHKTQDRTRPLGVISTPQMRKAKMGLHETVDRPWQSGHLERREVYRRMAEHLGVEEFHIGELRSVEEMGEARNAAIHLFYPTNRSGGN